MPLLQRAARLVFPLVVLTATMALAVAPALARDDNRGSGGGERDEDEGIVAIRLSDVTNEPAFTWAVSATPSATEEKKVTFNISNISRFIPHQFVVIKTDLAPDALPRVTPGPGVAASDVGVDESKVDVVARFQPPTPSQPPNTLAAGQSGVLSAKLKKGNYVLICNLGVTGSPRRAHYADGMRSGFRVGDDD
jgi:hypothetical protein